MLYALPRTYLIARDRVGSPELVPTRERLVARDRAGSPELVPTGERLVVGLRRDAWRGDILVYRHCLVTLASLYFFHGKKL